MEISLGSIPPGRGTPFTHRHRENEEVYIFVKGSGLGLGVEKKAKTQARQRGEAQQLSEHERLLFEQMLSATPDQRWQFHENFLRSHDLFTRSSRKKYGFK